MGIELVSKLAIMRYDVKFVVCTSAMLPILNLIGVCVFSLHHVVPASTH